MEKEKIKIVVAAGVIILLVIVLISNIAGAGRKKTQARPAVAKAGPVKAAVKVQDKDIPQPRYSGGEQAKAGSMESGRDPFVFGQAAAAPGDLVLSGIVWDEESPSAIINGEIVRIGRQIDGRKIIDIQKTKIILSEDGQIYELNLFASTK